ncbi:MAG: hypothetical protein QG632_366 [Candidatus Dependentiae bacterium]|nr:hypothetical protein [Candidatus Dependentiae bacterium]
MNKYAVKLIIFAVLIMHISAVSAGLRLLVKGGLQGRQEDTGTPVMVMCQGDDYVLQVVRDDGDLGQVVIYGVQDSDNFELTRGGTSNSMIMENGRSTSSVTNTYYLRPLVVGTFKLGPASLDENGQQIVSNAVEVRVVEPAAYDQFAGKRGAARQALACSIDVDTHEVYVGQPVTLTVVMEDNGQVMERGLQPPAFGKMQAQQVGSPTSSQKVVNGQLKVLTQQVYSLSADVPGTYTVGPATGVFVVPESDNHDPFAGGLWGGFFGPQGKKRSVRSNSTIIAVKPLPLSKVPVDGVGQFTGVALHADKQLVELNEPVMVTFAIIGRGNFDAITAPMLQLPETMEVYPSTASFSPDLAIPQKGVKSFEYVVQIGESGVHEIPAQRFTYFDTQQGEYITLSTDPVTIQVRKAKIVGTEQPAGPAGQEPKEKKPEVTKIYDGASLPVIPWWWVIYFALAIFFILLRDLLARGVWGMIELLGITSDAKRQRARLLVLIDAQEVGQIHAFFIKLLARAWHCDTEQIDAECVKRRTADWGWDMERSEGFADYIDRCSQAAFAQQMMKEAVKTELLDKTLYWYEMVVAQLSQK